MAPLIPGMENIDFLSWFGTIAYIVKWIFYSILMCAAAGVAWILTSYNIKATVFPLYGSGKDGIFSAQKSKWNRYRWNKQKTAWKPLLPPMNKKEVEPFDSEYIYPGKRIYAFDLNGEMMPGRINITQDEETLRAEINPVPYYVRNWQSLTHKKNALEYSTHDWWSENKTLMTALIAAGLILAAGLIFIYLTYKMAEGGRADISALTSAIRGVGNIPGTPPG